MDPPRHIAIYTPHIPNVKFFNLAGCGAAGNVLASVLDQPPYSYGVAVPLYHGDLYTCPVAFFFASYSSSSSSSFSSESFVSAARFSRSGVVRGRKLFRVVESNSAR